ncbi:hypothetical protein LAV82_23670 [Bacillus sp. ILBB4]|nr:hypothetical protein [Bacillus sp. ILBB4]
MIDMFKFQRFVSVGSNSVDNLYLNDAHIGTLGIDTEGIYLNLKKDLSLAEYNLLIAQLVSDNPTLLKENVQIAKVD